MAGTITRDQAKAILKPEGYVEYNGIVFSELVKTKLEIKSVPNHAGTGIKYQEFLFTIDAIITANDVRATKLSIDPETASYASDGYGINDIMQTDVNNAPVKTQLSPSSSNTSDANFRLLRKFLMRPGGRFVYANKGAGEDLIFSSDANNADKKNDVCFGPMPKTLSFEIIAGNKAARVVFQILVRTKECFYPGKSLGVLDFSVTTDIKTNSNGYKTINRRGYLEVSLPRAEESQLAANIGSGDTVYNNVQRIEEQHKQILQNLIGINMQGYRVSHEINFSPDHRSCEFTILYEEIESPNAYPNGVTNITCTHNTKTSLLKNNDGGLAGGSYVKWINTMSASITLRPNISPIKAWYVFTQILNERLMYNDGKPINFDDQVRIKMPLVLEIELEESIFSHEYRFRVTWVSWLDNVNELFEKTKIFKPLESTNWFDWTTDTRIACNSINGAYPLVPGKHGGDYFSTSICNSDTLDLHYTVNLETTRGYPPEFMFSLFGTACPPEDSSWLDYQRKFYVKGSIGERTYQRYKPTGDFPTRPSASSTPTSNKKLEMLDLYYDNSEDEYLTQDLGKDVFEVIERGYAIRLGGPTNPTIWSKIGGKKVKLLKDGDILSHHVISSAGNCPMVATTWERRYLILGKPNGDMSRSKEEGNDPKHKQ
jgi:hypothetical protein